VEHGNGGLEQRRLQVGVKRGQLGPDQERLVDDGAARERTDEHRKPGARRAALDHPAREVETPLPCLRVRRAGWRADEQLPDRGLARRGERAEDTDVYRNDPPAEHRHAQPNDDGFDEVDRDVARGAGCRQEEHAEGDAFDGAHAEQPVGDLGEDAGAIARLVVGGSAAMREPGDGRQGHRQDVAGAFAVGAGDEADAAGVALAPGVEQTKSPLC